MTHDQTYRRLPGKRRTLGTFHSLWIGDDHLLAVESTGYSERYTRFYLADIRGVLCRRTRNGTLWGLLFALLACLFLIFALAVRSHGLAVFCGVLAGSFLFALLANLVRGPTCVCHLLMPLGSQRLPSLGRVKQVTRLRDRIGPLIALVQGSTTAEELTAGGAAHPAAVPGTPGAAIPLPRTGSEYEHPLEASDYRGRTHGALFLLLIVDAGFTMVQLTDAHAWVATVASLLQLLLFAFAVIALVKQRGSGLPESVKRTVWGALGILCASLFALRIFTVFYAFSVVRRNPKGPDLQRLMGELNLLDQPTGAGIAGIYLAFAAGLGIFGLLALLRWQRAGAGTGGSNTA